MDKHLHKAEYILQKNEISINKQYCMYKYLTELYTPFQAMILLKFTKC